MRELNIEQQPELIEKIITINRVAKVTKGGKKLHFSALVVDPVQPHPRQPAHSAVARAGGRLVLMPHDGQTDWRHARCPPESPGPQMPRVPPLSVSPGRSYGNEPRP